MKWDHNQDAFMKGFADGYQEIKDTVIENRNHVYELGFITGASELRRQRLQWELERKRQEAEYDLLKST